MSFTLVSLYLDTFGTLIFITTSTTVLLSLLVAFEGVYQKKYLNILECSFFLNLGLLSALAAVFQNDDNSEQVVTIISVSVALATFTGILLFHVFLRVNKNKGFRKFIKKSKSADSEQLLKDDAYQRPLAQPTFTEVCLKRESLLEFSSLNTNS